MSEPFIIIGKVISDIKKGSKIPTNGYIGKIFIFSEFETGLTGIEDNDFIIVAAAFGESSKSPLKVYPKGNFDLPQRGVFSLRSPVRPNPIALDTLKLLKRDKNILTVSGLDFYDETPILDIKSYSPFNEILLSATQEKSFLFLKLNIDEKRELLMGFIEKSLGNLSKDSNDAIEYFLEYINKNIAIRSKKIRYKAQGSLEFLESVVAISGATLHSGRMKFEPNSYNSIEIEPDDSSIPTAEEN